jgi:hypothetical protein
MSVEIETEEPCSIFKLVQPNSLFSKIILLRVNKFVLIADLLIMQAILF